MTEYKLKINGVTDFIIISPRVLSSLIAKIHDSPDSEITVEVEEIMPLEFTEYLLRVINSNRFADQHFRYRYISEHPMSETELYEILRRQLMNASVQKSICFRNICLADTISGKKEFDIECSKPFFWVCKDSSSRFFYTCEDGRQELLVILKK